MKKILFIICLMSIGLLHAQDPQLDAAKAKIDAKNFEAAKADLKKKYWMQIPKTSMLII